MSTTFRPTEKTSYSATDLARRCREQRRGAVEEDSGVRLLLTLPAVVSGVGHAVVPHHHQQRVILQAVHHRPAGGKA